MKHYIGYGLLLLALVAAGVYIARQEIAKARAEERDKASKDTIAQIEKARQDFNAKLDAVQKQPATVQTVTKYVAVPLPPKSEVKIETPLPTPETPNPQSYIALTGDVQTNLDWIRDMEIGHLKCDNDLLACSKERDQWKLDSQNWENTAKGGSKWTRAVKILKCAGVAGGGAAVGSFWGSRGAAIGGAAGSAGCAIFW